MGKKVLLITGCNGMIAKVLRHHLEADYEVFGLDLRGPFSPHTLQADIADLGALKDVLGRLPRPEYVLHLAGASSMLSTWDEVLTANIIGTRNVYEASRELGVKRIVFASSNHVTGAYEGLAPNLYLYKEHDAEKVTISHPIRPDSDYGVSKAFGEALARYYCAQWGVESICLRIGTVLANDDPTSQARFRKTWLSHRDLLQLVRKSLTAKVAFGIYFGVSNNQGAFWDVSSARRDLGYEPQDDAALR